MRDARYFNGSNITLAISNLYSGKRCSVVQILDAVEDSKTAEELVDRLNSFDILEKFTIDRTTNEYVRLKSWDSFGALHYFKAYYD